MKKKLIASAVSFAMLFTTAFCGIGTPVYAAASSSTDLPEIVKDNTTFVRDPETGHIATVEDKSDTQVPGKAKSVTPNTAALPASYGNINAIKSNFPNTRDQNPYGTCWSHAAAACAEFDLVKNHYMPKSYADFSELQLAYLHYNTGKEMPGLDGDQTYIPSSAAKNYLEVGGNIIYSMHTLAQWKCFNYESSLPYSTVVNNKNYNPYSNISGWSNNSYHGAAQLRNVRRLNIKSDPVSVKQAITNNGAVYISYCHESENYKTSGSTGYYYNPVADTTNHDVVIVGWDDNAYVSGWPAKGGWLVRNSWSTDQSAYNSEYTYFYMSYYDASLASNAYSLDFEAYSSADNIYQHNGITTYATINVNSIANVFTANYPMDSNSEKLDSVMLTFTSAENVNYKIEVYTGLTSSSPTSGYLNTQATTTGWTSTSGIYTVPLNSPVYLSPGEKYSVVVTALNGPKKFDIECSTAKTYNQNGSTYTWFTTVASADPGESFFDNYGTWIDATTYGSGYGNLTVKALTVDDSTVKYNISYDMKGGTNNASNPSYFLSSQSGSVTLQNPTRSGYHFAGWYSDSGYSNKVTAINRNNKYNQTLYARWCSNSNPHTTQVFSKATMTADGSYQTVCSSCGNVKAGGTSYKASSVKLNYAKTAYTGSNRSPVPVIKTSAGEKLKSGTDYTYKNKQTARKNTGRYSVTVKFKGRYSGSKTLWFTVVPKAPATASAKLHAFKGITVTWAKATGATGYYVYYKKASAAKYVNYKLTKNRTIKFTNLAANTKYNFKIVPYYKKGETNYKANGSKIVSATTLKKLKQPSISKTYDGNIYLAWDTCKGATGYQVYWAHTKTGKYNFYSDYGSRYSGITFSTGINETYWWKTRAYKKVGNKKIFGPWSDPKAFTLR